jgi:hypothetical protein
MLFSRLPNKSQEELDSLANFLEDLPLAIVQVAASIREFKIDVRDYIDQFSNIVNIDDKIKNILAKNIESFSEECLHILKIVCLGYCDNIPYDMLYEVFKYKYSEYEDFDFKFYLGEIVKFYILSYDAKN